MVTSSFLPGRGGIESYLAELAGELAPRLAVMAQAQRDGKPIPDDLPYPTVGYQGRLFLPTATALKAVLETAGRLGVDKVLFGTPWPAGLLGPGLAAAGLRYSAIVHGAEVLVPAVVPGPASRLARSLAGADHLFFVSEFTRLKVEGILARRALPRPPATLLRARVDLGRFHPDARAAELAARWGLEGRPVILCLGRLVRRKGAHRLIAAMPGIARRIPNAVLLIAGTGPQAGRLRRMAARSSADIRLLGRIAKNDMPACYALADVFALPVADRLRGLDIEGLGVVLLEAAACGTPCVTGKSGGTPEAVIDESTGFVVDATNEQQLAGAIVALLSDPDRAKEMGARGRRHVASQFSRAGLPESLLTWLGETTTIKEPRPRDRG